MVLLMSWEEDPHGERVLPGEETPAQRLYIVCG